MNLSKNSSKLRERRNRFVVVNQRIMTRRGDGKLARSLRKLPTTQQRVETVSESSDTISKSCEYRLARVQPASDHVIKINEQ